MGLAEQGLGKFMPLSLIVFSFTKDVRGDLGAKEFENTLSLDVKGVREALGPRVFKHSHVKVMNWN